MVLCSIGPWLEEGEIDFVSRRGMTEGEEGIFVV